MHRTIYIKTTETCNLNCKHCFTSGSQGAKIYWNMEATLDWVTRLAAHEKIDSVHFEFHGGEPMLAPLSEMVEFVHKVRSFYPEASFGITTNLAYKLTDEAIRFFKEELKGQVGTSWDPEIRFSNEKQQDLWLKNLNRLTSEGIKPVLNISVSRALLSIPIKQHLTWLTKLDASSISYERISYDGNATMHKDLFPSNKEIDAWYLNLYKAYEEMDLRGKLDIRSLEDLYAMFETGSKCGTFCRDCEQRLFTVNADGGIAGCPNSAPTDVYGTISQRIEELLTSSKRTDAICQEIMRDPRCITCSVFKYCGSDCHKLAWDGDTCPAPKSTMMHMAGIITETRIMGPRSIPIFKV